MTVQIKNSNNSFIITKTPLRLPLGGGGTDLPEYYTNHNGGQWISAAINNYIYVILKNRFEQQSKFVYSETQYVDSPSQFTHPILRAVFTKYNHIQHLELVSLADLPAHLGLGSSGAFTVSLLNAVHSFLNSQYTPEQLAEEAYEIERHILQRKIGKQDQYASTFGGLNIYTSNGEGKIKITQLDVPELQEWLLLFYVNQRSIPADEAITSLTQQDQESIALIGFQSMDALKNKDFELYGKLMSKHWTVKGRTQPLHFSYLIDHAKHHGAIGGKLCGAGQGGCILLVVPPKYHSSVIKSMLSIEVIQIPFKFEPSGSGVCQ